MAFFTIDQLAILSASTVRVAPLVEFNFDSGDMFVWNGLTELVSGGKTWSPMMGAGSIDGIGYSSGGVSDTVTVAVNGLSDESIPILAQALDETDDVNQRSIRIYLQLFADDWQPVGSPIGIWWGFMQPPTISRTPMQGVDGGVQSISITAENAFFNRSRPPHGRYTDRDQQNRSAGDKFFQFTPSLIFKNFTYPDY